MYPQVVLLVFPPPTPSPSDAQLRNLPCQHAFHAGCITPWLTERQRTCPMCKNSVTTSPASPSSASTAVAAAAPLTARAEPAAQGAQAAPASPGSNAPFWDATRGGPFWDPRRGRRGLERRGPGEAGAGRGGGGDRLPLLTNSRGPPSDGGSIQEPSPV